jgi:hypothetical protein
MMVIACLLWSKLLENMWPFKTVSSFGKKQWSCGEMFCEYRHRIFDKKTPEQLEIHGRSIIWMRDTSFRPKFSLLSSNGPLLPYEYFEETLLIHSLTVFKILKVNNVLVIKNLISVVFTWILDNAIPGIRQTWPIAHFGNSQNSKSI